MKKLLSAMIGITASLFLGCGGSDSTTGATASTGSSMEGTNGCTSATAEDHTMDSGMININFGGAAGNAYSPACIKISKNHQITFNGNFTTHPLQGGLVDAAGKPTPDPSSPISETTTGTSKAVNFPASGTYGYYCEVHVVAGMKGAIFVE